MQVEKKGKTVIPENIQKKNKKAAQVKDERSKSRTQRQADAKKKSEEIRKRGEKYFKATQYKDAQLIKNLREAKANNSFFVPAEAKVLLVVRVRGINHIDPRSKRIMRLFRLRQLHNATFVRVNKATLNMLKHINPYVTFGYPDRKTISMLLYKRGHMKISKQRIPITSNKVVETALQGTDIICIEDLIEEILNVGPNFKKANNAIWPLKLSSPKFGFLEKRHPYQNGGVWGNREGQINELVRRML